MKPRCWVVLPAAGAGRRMGTSIPKQYLTVLGRTVLEHTLSIFTDRVDIAGIAVALASDDPYWPELQIPGKERFLTLTGGDDRMISVRNALHALSAMALPDDWVLVHDAARPCLREEDLSRLIETLYDDPVGGILATPLRDTLKRQASDARHIIEATIDRDGLWLAQTPQMFRLGALSMALNKALELGWKITDEASAMERWGASPHIVRGHADNLKITHAEDLPLAEFLLSTRT
ncbi:2-C-methyl-D-erythritol 4-phosphate cytidylyltransferase [Acidihalobacter aeolianus]|uniref:2-C-methyl-D-erythritol 4-phosphate cytidylyltransferase n=1 Tax=Acidihalobacter aeolianus TaxID=2792603 RepID=A0A1D8K7F0_9GAMM|nr:2-C-methyl-D-erythritol 4-phosphate cytidylyltransferase [Acidihalobacter aeolianus]AOV16891.1 2-C-methyl-D-erythritol 4-phosphate cytidylyltransferase [Acidihalobacter aeolianus]